MTSLSCILSVSVPVLLLSGCGDAIEPDSDTEDGIETTMDDDSSSVPPALSRPITGFIGFSHPDCDRASLAYEAVISYQDDGSPVLDPQCLFSFSDGTQSFDCAGVHEFATAGMYGVTMSVRDPSSEETHYVEAETIVYPALSVDVTAQAPACGLELSWSSEISTSSETHTTISPGDLVVGGGLHIGGAGSARVTAPGTYTITVLAEDERTTGPICQASASKTIEVVACPDEHEHTPTCPH